MVITRRSFAAASLVLSISLACVSVQAQSHAVSEASSASLDASVRVPVASYEALKASGEFAITAVHASAEGVVIGISVAGVAAGSLLLVSIEPDYDFSGTPDTLSGKVIVTSMGLLLQIGEAIVAFIPSPDARKHIHSEKIA